MNTQIVTSGSPYIRPKDLDDEVVINADVENFANDIFPLIGETHALNNSAQSLRLASNNTAVLQPQGDNTHQKVDAQIKSSVNPFSKPKSSQTLYQFGPEKEVLSCLQRHPLGNKPFVSNPDIVPTMAKAFANKQETISTIILGVSSELEAPDAVIKGAWQEVDAMIVAVVNCGMKERVLDKKTIYFGSSQKLVHCLKGNPLSNRTYLEQRKIPDVLAQTFANQKLDSHELMDKVNLTMLNESDKGNLPFINGIARDMEQALTECANFTWRTRNEN